MTYRRATAKDLLHLVQSELKSLVREKLPRCVLWSFREDLVLPSSIAWNQFIQDPTEFPIVNNMFALAGVHDVQAQVSQARQRTTGVRTLLERVGTKTTNHLRAAWDGFSDLALELHENGKLLESCGYQHGHKEPQNK